MSQQHPDGRIEPTSSRPDMPESYAVRDPTSGAGLLPWSRVGEHMTRARNYWVGTTRPDGRPHIMPVWGVWLDETFYFATDRDSRKARNLAANPRLAVHLESGDDVVILEGVAEQVADSALLARFADAYEAKYQFRPSTSSPEQVTYALRTNMALTWLESDFTGSATRWLLGAT